MRTIVTWAAVIVGLFVVGAAALWILPAALTHHPTSGMSAAERLKAANDVRTPLVGFLLAAGTAVTVWFTARTFRLNREGQVTERYTRAVEHIGNSNLEVRIGGIYALERIGRDSPADRRTIIYVLGAFVRHRSIEPRGTDDGPSEDVYAALRVISRLAPGTDLLVNLDRANLRNTQLQFMRDVRVRIDGADLENAIMPDHWSP